TSDKTVKISHLFKEYNSNYDVTHGIVSDNYVFRPMGSARMVTDNKVDLQLVKGQYVQEARQSYYSFLEPNISRFSVIVRLFNTPPLQAKDDETLCGHIELQFRVGPLSINKELITRFSTNLTNGKVIYTDENAYQMMKRNFRKNTTEPIAQNYYPMVSTAYIEDEKKDLRLTLLSERSHGVSSLTDGQMEVMLHRRLINNQEMAQNYNLTLNDTSVVMPTLWLLLGNKVRSSYLQHRGWLELENPPVVIVINQSCNDELKELGKYSTVIA
ncbi:epididymis-specific alpha-mannosidase-like, partial [Saccoglossus kowalevskii]